MSADSWSRKKLGDILTLEYGKGLTRDSRSGWGFPVYGSSGEVGRHNEYLIPGPSIIVGRKGSVGAVSWVDSPSWPIDTTYYVAPSEQIDLRWCYWLLDWMSLQKLDASTGVPGLNRHDAYRVSVKVPPLEEQRRIAGILDTVDAAIRQTDELIAKLQQIKAGLLHDLLTRGLDEASRLRDPEAHPEQFRETALGRLPAGWRVGKLEEFYAVPSRNGLYKSAEHYGRGTPMIHMTQMFRGLVVDVSDADRVELTQSELDRFSLQEGDLVFARRSLNLEGAGRCSLIPELSEPTVFESSIIRVRLISEELRPAYANHFLNSEMGFRLRLPFIRQVAVSGVSSEDVASIPVCCPPVEEQDAILELLNTHDDRIRAEEAYRDKLAKLKQGLMRDLLAGRVRTTDVVLDGMPAGLTVHPETASASR